jgi:Fic family protein
MKVPLRSPSADDCAAALAGLGTDWHLRQGIQDDRYLPWDELRRRKAPDGLNHLQWWAMLRFRRTLVMTPLPLSSPDGEFATLCTTNRLQRSVAEVDRRAGGSIGAFTSRLGPLDRDRVLLSSLQEEAITSSQLEGASTTRQVAKRMLTSGRPPRTSSERMIANNYRAMEHLRSTIGHPLVLDDLLELHQIITEGTLEDSDDEGRMQRPGDVRVGVYDTVNGVDTLLHEPPAAALLPERMERLLTFINRPESAEPYIHPVAKAIIAHFWIGYDHPFADGNGRLARAVMYRSLLADGYWLAEFLSISAILKARPTKYARSFLYCEGDALDLTYFVLDQLAVLGQALTRLDEYVERKRSELDIVARLIDRPDRFNHRQRAVLGRALAHPGREFTISEHAREHHVVYQTARTDLLALAEAAFVETYKRKQQMVFVAPVDLDQRLSRRR